MVIIEETAGIGDSHPKRCWTFSLKTEQPFPPSLQPHAARESLTQWGLAKGLSFHCFTYDAAFRPAVDSEAFLLDFLRDPAVRQAFQAPAPPQSLRFQRLSTKVVSLAFFDRLEDAGVVIPQTGYIRKCFDEDIDGLLVSDQLRELLANEDSVHAELFSLEDKQELIYCIFAFFALGGGMCQPEDSIHRYLEMTKALYKDLCRAQKNAWSGQIEVASVAFLIEEARGKDQEPYPLFSRHSRYNRAIAVVDPEQKMLTLTRANWQPFW